jgi:hypothetical protein
MPIELDISLNDTDVCAICLSENIENPVITDCSHVYCKRCLEDWFDTGNIICPLCRDTINTYKNSNNNYKLVIIKSNSSVNTPNPILEIRQHNTNNVYNVHRKLALYKFYLCSMFITFIYINYIYYKLLYKNTILNNRYNSCMLNLTDTTNQLDTAVIEPHHISVGILLHGHFTKCMIPENYIIYC